MGLSEQVVSFLVGIVSSALVTLIGVRSVRQIRADRRREKALREVLGFWEEAGNWNIVCGCEDASTEAEPEPRVGYAEAYGMAEIKRLLQTISGQRELTIHLTVLKRHEAIPRELFRENVVIMGGVRSLEQFGVLCRLLRIPYQSTSDSLYDRTFGFLRGSAITDPYCVSELDKDEERVRRDYGLIIRVRNRENGKLIILLDGSYSAGLAAATLIATSNPRLRETHLLDHLRPTPEGLEIVVQVVGIIENVITLPEPDMGNVTPWTPFPVDRAALSNALTAISRKSFMFTDSLLETRTDMHHPSDRALE